MLIKNSKWLPYNSHKTALASDWLPLSLSNIQHGQNKEDTANGGG